MRVTWEEVPKISAAGPAPGACAVDPEAAWNLANLPTLVRSYVKRQALEDGSYERYIKEEHLPEIRRIRSRVSANIFRLYMTGDWKVPSPMEDTIGTKYGMRVKDEGRRFMLRFFGTRDMTMTKLLKRMVWLEGRMSAQLREFAGEHILAL